VVIVGGGIAGLSIAHYLATTSNKSVTVLDRTGPAPSSGDSKTESASSASQGGLGQQFFGKGGAPYDSLYDESNETFGSGLLLSMCLKSRDMYEEWTNAVEEGAKNCPFWAADKYWWDEESELERWEVGYRSDQTTAVTEAWKMDDELYKKNREDSLKLQPLLDGLRENWWFVPKTASVDAQRLMCSLRAACAGAGVDMRFGENGNVESLLKDGEDCIGVKLAKGEEIMGSAVVVANGIALNELMKTVPELTETVPVVKDAGNPLLTLTTQDKSQFMDQAVLGEGCSILSKPGGRVLISSCQDDGVDQNVVAARAASVVPAVSVLGFVRKITAHRPMTQDFLPILGQKNGCGNLYVAGGFNYYGVMLAPKIGKLIGDLILCGGEIEKIDGEDEKLFLTKCSPERKVMETKLDVQPYWF